MHTVYQHPYYYDIAFSFRDIAHEVDLFEQCIAEYAHTPVKRFLELGCGPSPHMEELVHRGYAYTGIDTCEAMLDYATVKSQRIGAPVDLICADMIDFSLETPVDFAYVMLGSLYIENTQDMTSHFDAMGRVVTKGGLYLLEWCVHFDQQAFEIASWDVEQEGIYIKATYSSRLVNVVEQLFKETLILHVEDHSTHKDIQEQCFRRAIYPQEFLTFLSHRDDFEFVGWWNDWNLSKPLRGKEPISRPIVLLRKT